ncbi:hypothetical protein AB0F81_15535 [Actinoplanes sp. NPDC024001]|uniref:hypothetical protein n=1 Tax=Actinoplanes sp. NPDC024001 TaxID=3154598 RepID=UPI0033CA6A07
MDPIGEAIPVEALGPLGEEIGSGGQGRVFAVPMRPPFVFKEYRADLLGEVDVGVLASLVGLLHSLDGEQRAHLQRHAAWPVHLVSRNGVICGFLMERLPPDFLVRVRLLSGYRDLPGQVQLLLNDDQYLAARELPVDDRFRLELLTDVAATMAVLHRLDVAVGDLSPNNLYFSWNPPLRCHFIDCDAMRVRGGTVLPPVETDDWQVPRPDEQPATKQSDSYKFGLLCVRLFAGDQSTTDPAPVRRAGPAVYALARRSLSASPRRRPSLRDWERALRKALVTPAPAPTPVQVVQAPVRPRRRFRFRWVFRLAMVSAVLFYGVPQLSACQDWVRETIEAATAGSDPTAQAAAVAALLADSAQDRKQVNAAVQDVIDCKRLNSAAARLRKAAVNRGVGLDRVEQLEVGELPSGEELRARMTEAFTHSRAADVAYRRWAQVMERGKCGAKARRSTDRKRGDAESAKARKAKAEVERLWFPIAVEYGQPQFTQRDI